MRGSPTPEAEEWAMPERREHALMKGVPPARARDDAPDFKLPTPRGVLSKAEIEALLRPNLPKINESEDPHDETAEDEQPVTFEDVAAISSEQGRQLASRLTLLFAQSTGLRASFRFKTARRAAGMQAALDSVSERGKSAYVCFGHAGEEVSEVLEIPSALGDALISHACGGSARMANAERSFSAIDCALIEQLLAPVRAAFGTSTQLISVETEQRYVGSVASGDAVDELVFECELSDRTVEVCLFRVPQIAEAPRAETGGQPGKRPVQAVLTARVASLSVPVSRVSQLKAGDTLLLGLPADQPIQLLSGGRDGVPAFEGQIGRKGANMAIRIRKIFER